jgi:hypothetical protein
MLLNTFTVFHVVLSLIGIGSGVVVLYGLIKAKMLAGWTKLFLASTAATSKRASFSRSTASRLPWRSASCRSPCC